MRSRLNTQVGDREDDAGNMDSHAHALVPDVVALAEIVGAAGTGESYRPQDGRNPDLVYLPGEVSDARRDLGDDPRPFRQVGGYNYRHHQEGYDDDEEHHFDSLDGVVYDWGDGYREGDGEEQNRDDPWNGALTEAGEVGQRRGGARCPAWESVGQDLAENDDSITQKPLNRRGLASGLS